MASEITPGVTLRILAAPKTVKYSSNGGGLAVIAILSWPRALARIHKTHVGECEGLLELREAFRRNPYPQFGIPRVSTLFRSGSLKVFAKPRFPSVAGKLAHIAPKSSSRTTSTQRFVHGHVCWCNVGPLHQKTVQRVIIGISRALTIASRLSKYSILRLTQSTRLPDKD
jgi:hypothetical protein